VRSRPGADVCVVLLAGAAEAVERARMAFELGEHAAFVAALDLPPCCAGHAARRDPPRAATAALVLPESLRTHALLAPLGLSVLPVLPCAPDCPSAAEAAERRLAQAAAQGYVEEVGWLRECLSWAMVRSDLHGVAEIKTPVLKMAMEGPSEAGPREIRRLGPTWTEGAVVGLRFPFAAPAKLGRDSHGRHAL
jgi:thioesterase domain-containing protein